MTTQKLVDLFNVLIDKYGSPYLTDQETVDLLNMAHYEYINRLIPDSQGGVVNFEFDSNTIQNLKPLIWSMTVNTNGSGLVTTAALDTALQTTSSDATAEVMRVMSIGYNNRPVKYLKQNNLWSFTRNTFKAPSATSPSFTVRGDGYQFYPSSALNGLQVTVLKTPKTLSLTPSVVNPELSDYVLFNVCAIALKLGAVSIHDSQILQDVRMTANQIAQ